MARTKEQDAERKRAERAKRKAERELEAKEKADTMAAFVAELTGSRAEVEMSDVEAVATMADEDEKAKAEDALADYMAKRYVKNRTWAFIIYPESCPTDWEDKLRMKGVVAAASPLHDADVTKDGKPKKPHYHVIVDWPGGSTTFRTVAAISRNLLKGTLPIPLASPRGYYRYLTHADSPDKAQYDKAGIVHINGFDVGNFLDLTAAEKIKLRKELDVIIAERNIREYGDLMTYVRLHCSDDMYELASTSTTYFSAVLRSRRHAPPKYDYKTGNELVWNTSEDGSYSFVGEIDPDTGEMKPTT